jgi:hypothetical protein
MNTHRNAIKFIYVLNLQLMSTYFWVLTRKKLLYKIIHIPLRQLIYGEVAIRFITLILSGIFRERLQSMIVNKLNRKPHSLRNTRIILIK